MIDQDYVRQHRDERWIYTIRTQHDMAVFYVGCCLLPMNRVRVHRAGTRPVSKKIQEYEKNGVTLITVFEERILPSKNIGRHWSFVEMDYIRGYSKLLGAKLTNVIGNSARKKGFQFASALAS